MDPITGTTEVLGALGLVSGITAAAAQGNYFWVVSTIVYILLELGRGEIPGTNIKIPGLPQLIGKHVSENNMKLIAMVGSAVVAVIFVLSGRPIEPAVADFAIGWIGAMGLHDAADILKKLKSSAGITPSERKPDAGA